VSKINTNLEKELKKLDKTNKSNLVKMEESITKLKAKLSDLYHQVNEDEESEISSNEELEKDSDPEKGSTEDKASIS
jgi:type VII secretion effector (TIGR04197 family)